jgi:hypothetical protein
MMHLFAAHLLRFSYNDQHVNLNLMRLLDLMRLPRSDEAVTENAAGESTQKSHSSSAVGRRRALQSRPWTWQRRSHLGNTG